ncbi:glycosyltransferase family 4 protein [Roseicyclus amphidinii]|uniref:glycosyltransferase family 4 protein n=1 Tax=Roseicyclus amphidinii TaxID=3034232 RepID=UPI0024E0FE08|nr:glycosyltransferase family 4 protein [Roseicyclus sp. Amp-Y-6]
MHVLITVNATWNVWNFRRPLVEALIADGHEVTVLAPRDETAAQLEALGCRIHPLEMSVKGMNPARDAALLWRLRRAFRVLRPDVVLGFTIKPNIYGALAAKAVGVPFVPNVTGLGTAFLSGGALERVAVALYRRAFHGLPVVFFQNADDRALFLGRGLVGVAQARLLPGSGIDLGRFAPTPSPATAEGPAFLMIARLLRDKGVLEYVEAAHLVRRIHPEARFRLLGAADAANRSAIGIETVRGWEAEGVIDYLGTTDDVRPAIAEAHCVVLPSYREGAPRTLIEAAAMARPLVATDVPGCRSVVADGETGLLCDVRSAESLAEACLRMIALGPSGRAAMGMAGRRKMEREYDQAIVVQAYRDAVADVTGRGAGSEVNGEDAR